MNEINPPTIDLSTCDDEPIHHPGRIQPHGILLVLEEPGLLITQASLNTTELLGVPPGDLLDQPLSELLAPDCLARVTAVASATDPRPLSPIPLSVNGKHFDGIAHRHAGRFLLELESADVAWDGIDPDRLVRFTLLNLRNGLHLREFCGAIAREVRTLTGYDRVMVYRFDPDWNGEVFAEEKRNDLEPFLGLHYPASDIPAQARRLYHLNLIRHIPNITYNSSPLVPELDPGTGQALDLSHSVLRSVSPMHIEYLQNMGVAGTLTISLLKDGKLWGLIACHHYAPLFLPYRVRAACETLGVLVSLQLSAKLDAEDLRCRMASQARLGRLCAALDIARDVPTALTQQGDDLTGLTEATGAAVALGDRVHLAGKTPGADLVRRLTAWIQDAGHEEYATNTLPMDFPEAPPETASGLLALCVGGGDYLLWFRPEIARTVSWAGDPHSKQVVMGVNGPRLTPRGSFDLWSEEQRGKSERWSTCDREAAKALLDAVRAVQARQATTLEAEASRRDDFLAAVAHELRSPLAPIQNAANLVRMSAGRAEVATRAAEMIDRQVGQLTRIVEDLLDASRAGRGKLRLDLRPVDLARLVRAIVEDARPGMESSSLQLEIQGPDDGVWVQGDSHRLTQVLTNLVTNAAKFTDRGGRISVAVSTAGPDALVTVTDTGIGIPPEMLPHLFEPFVQIDGSINRSRQGLGLGLSLVKTLAHLHGGDAWASSPGPGKGATFTVRLPTTAAHG